MTARASIRNCESCGRTGDDGTWFAYARTLARGDARVYYCADCGQARVRDGDRFLYTELLSLTLPVGWRGTDPWSFATGPERDPARNGPEAPPEELEPWGRLLDRMQRPLSP
ncbi:MAG: hypothetical protein ACT4PT_03550 [Methanobacteriota archaeon]